MFFHRKRSIVFPVLVIGLSLILIGIVLTQVSPSSEVQVHQEVKEREETPVDDQAYRNDLRDIVRDFQTFYQGSSTDIERLVAAENASDSILSLKVPTQYRDLHLDLVVSLNLVISGLKGEGEELEKGLEQFDQKVNENPWLSK